jgi:hypothetical protein
MNKFLKSLLFFYLAFDLSANTSLEITTIEIQDSYNITQRWPGKLLSLFLTASPISTLTSKIFPGFSKASSE